MFQLILNHKITYPCSLCPVWLPPCCYWRTQELDWTFSGAWSWKHCRESFCGSCSCRRASLRFDRYWRCAWLTWKSCPRPSRKSCKCQRSCCMWRAGSDWERSASSWPLLTCPLLAWRRFCWRAFLCCPGWSPLERCDSSSPPIARAENNKRPFFVLRDH